MFLVKMDSDCEKSMYYKRNILLNNTNENKFHSIQYELKRFENVLIHIELF